MIDNPNLPRANPSRRPLAESQKIAIIALLSNGSNRRKAAAYVGCAPSTITRLARRRSRR